MGWFSKIKKKVKGTVSAIKKTIQKSGYETGKKVAKAIKKPAPKTITAPTPKIDPKKPAAETIKAVDKPTPTAAKPTPKPAEEVKVLPKSPVLPTKEKPYEKMTVTEQKEARQAAVEVASAGGITPTAQDVLMAVGATAPVAAAKSSMGIISGIKAAIRTRSISNLASKTGMSVAEITKIITKAELKGGVTGIINSMSAKSLASQVVKYGLIVGGTAGMISWYAMDNIITGQKFYLKDILEGVESGAINPVDARNAAFQNKKTMDTAIDFLDKATIINPLLWPFRNLIMTGVEADEEANDLRLDAINVAAGEAESKGVVAEEPSFYELADEHAKAKREQELSWREEDKAYYDAINEAQKRQLEEQRLQDIEENKEDAAFYQRIAEQRRLQELEWRKEDRAYFQELAKQKKKEWENRQKSKLTFGIV